MRGKQGVHELLYSRSCYVRPWKVNTEMGKSNQYKNNEGSMDKHDHQIAIE